MQTEDLVTDPHDADGETSTDISTDDCERKTDGTEADSAFAAGPDSPSTADASDAGTVRKSDSEDPPESRSALLSRPSFATSSTWIDRAEFYDLHTPRITPTESGTETSAQPTFAQPSCSDLPFELRDI